MRIVVAMCARARSATLADCWARLRAEAPDALLFESEPSGGLAAARNAALAAARDADVLALVEDDTLVPPGWRAALERAWAAAAADVACQGGPIRPAFAGARPAWLGAALEPALGVFDHGPVARDVDLRATTFHGANLSVRAAALRGAGGFWPARGHAATRDWFSEEHHAQHALAAAGWRGRYDPALAVERLVAPRRGALLRARVRYGARDSAVGRRRPAGAAAGAVARGTGGALVAATRGDGARATERLARAAENAGALLGPLLVHGDLQPTARQTPFRASVPPPVPSPPAAARRALTARLRPRRRGALVLLYHRVAEPETDPLGLAVRPVRFAEQLDVLRSERRPMALDELTAALRAGGAPEGAVALTFDDGYADNLREALPRLERAGVPATVFIATEGVESGRGWWWDEVERILRAAPGDAGILEIAVDGDARRWPARDRPERATARAQLHAWLQPRAAGEIADALEQLRAWARVDAATTAPADVDRPLALDELARLAASPLIAIGAHTRRHTSLARQPAAARDRDIADGRDDLARWLGAAPAVFSYPFGVPGADVDAAAREAVARAGFATAVTNAPRVLRGREDPRLLGRLAVPDAGGDDFAAWLSASSARSPG